MRVLLTCNDLVRASGSQAYVRDVAVGFLRAGHEPVVYSPRLGPVAGQLRSATVPVVVDLAAVGAPPDVVLGSHHAELMTALLFYPRLPGVHVCHAWTSPEAYPPRFPRIRRYVAVDETVRDRLVSEEGIGPDRVEVVLNPVDATRFPPRPPLPARPRTALLFSNYATETTHLPAVREACARTGLQLEVVGAGVGRVVEDPGPLLARADVVFAKARSALEALVAGAAVVLCDTTGSGPLVTSREFAALRRRNLGIRTLDRPLAPGLLAAEIARYDAADAARTAALARESASLTAIVGELEAVLRASVAAEAAAGSPDREAEERAAAAYVRWLDQSHLQAAGHLHEVIETERRAAAERVADVLRGVEGTAAELRWMRSSATWRLRARLLGIAGLGRLWRALRGRRGVEA